jgi:hypothetical protein
MTLPEIYEADIVRRRSSLEWGAVVESTLYLNSNGHSRPFFLLTIDHVQVYSIISFNSRQTGYTFGARKKVPPQARSGAKTSIKGNKK